MVERDRLQIIDNFAPWCLGVCTLYPPVLGVTKAKHSRHTVHDSRVNTYHTYQNITVSIDSL